MSVRIHKSLTNQPSNLSQIAPDLLERLKDRAKKSIQHLVQELFEEEVIALAGPAYQRGRCRKTGAFRGGSDPGSIKFGGQLLEVRKPRLKRNKVEVQLESYKRLQDWDVLTPKILEHVICGVSNRNYDELLDEVAGGLGLSKSSVSRAFVRGSKQAVDTLKNRSLKDRVWASILIDGIYFKSRCVIVALGVDGAGEKMVLGLKEGNTESAAVCKDLLQELIDRGLDPSQPSLFVIDGGRGVRRALQDVFGEKVAVQRCRIHKARNIREYLPEKVHGEFGRRWNRLRAAEQYDHAKHELQQLSQWLSAVSPEAAASLDEAGEELLTAVRLKTPAILRRSLTTTNAIENIFGQVRARSHRVKNWRSSPDQVQRWLAVLLLYSEKGYNRLHGYFDCPQLIKNLKSQSLHTSHQVA